MADGVCFGWETQNGIRFVATSKRKQRKSDALAVIGIFKLYQKGQLSEEAWLPFERQIRGSLQNKLTQIWGQRRISPVSDSMGPRKGHVARSPFTMVE